jgi:3-dehydroquinate synthase
MAGHMSEQFEIEVKSSQFSYYIGTDFQKLQISGKRNVLIVDAIVRERSLELFSDQEYFIEVTVSEEEKTLDTVKTILSSLAGFGITRGDQIIAVGGGALQDLVTLAASIYMRGIDWHFVPTTLMSMLDSCIGGKSSINLGEYKNLIGNFYPPKMILIDPGFLTTLNDVDIASGLAEGVKICFAGGKETAADFESLSNEWKLSRNSVSILSAIFLSLKTKKWFVEVDEFDKKERRLLNFGHSFGHALESASGYAVPHGVGVFIGMYSAILRSNQVDSCQNLCSYIENETQAIVGLVPKFKFDSNTFLDSMKRDKKNSEIQQVLILPDQSGKLIEATFEMSPANLEKCLNSLTLSLDKLGFEYEVL